jgi:uncharacterized membrane protein YfcA
MTEVGLALPFLAFLLGGILKGAVGAGAPVVAVPILSMLYGVPFAVSVFVLPNLFSNLVQAWQFRKHLRRPKFALAFALSGALGAGFGSLLLAWLPADILMRSVAIIVIGYVMFRLFRPAWQLPHGLARVWVVPMGLIGGILQGANGISAPISITFLNALRLERAVFIATISTFFVAMSLIQIPTLFALNILTFDRLVFSLVALVPLFGGMLIGARLARLVQATTFDRLILVLLTLIALKLLFFPNG